MARSDATRESRPGARRPRSTGRSRGRRPRPAARAKSPRRRAAPCTRSTRRSPGSRRSSSRRRAARRASSAPVVARARPGARRRRRPARRRRRPRRDRRRRSAGATVVGDRRQVEHLLEVAAGLVDAGPVGLVDHEDVGDLQQPGLVGLHRVAPARVDHHDGGVGRAGDLDLDLAHADGLDDAPTRSRRRRAPGPPRASPAPDHRGGRGSPSSG